MRELADSIKRSLLSLLFAAILSALCRGVYRLNADLLIAFLWYAVLSAVLFGGKRLSAKPTGLAAVTVLFALWAWLNQDALRLLETAVRTNPYGDYFFNHFRLRLKLSIFILKLIAAIWPSDVRLVLTALMLSAHALTFPTLRDRLFRRLRQQEFEFTVFFLGTALRRSGDYLRAWTTAALFYAPLWGAAAYLLQFDNAVLLLFIMAAAAAIPGLGFFIGIALSLFFVESGLFLFQLGGMSIAAASIWFIRHSLLPGKASSETPWLYLAVLPAVFYLFSFAGLFAAAPLTVVGRAFAAALLDGLPLRFPRNRDATV